MSDDGLSGGIGYWRPSPDESDEPQSEWPLGDTVYRLVKKEVVPGGEMRYIIFAKTIYEDKALVSLDDDVAVLLYHALGKALWPSLEQKQ